MDKITHHMRCEQWTKIINECLDSGMSKTAWCKINGISEKAFYYWCIFRLKSAPNSDNQCNCFR